MKKIFIWLGEKKKMIPIQCPSFMSKNKKSFIHSIKICYPTWHFRDLFLTSFDTIECIINFKLSLGMDIVVNIIKTMSNKVHSSFSSYLFENSKGSNIDHHQYTTRNQKSFCLETWKSFLMNFLKRSYFLCSLRSPKKT